MSITDHLMTVFSAALDLDSGAGRHAYLDQACAGNSELRAEVEALLRAHDEAGRFLEPAPEHLRPTAPFHEPDTATHLSVPNLEAGAMVAGRYKLIEVMGEGGMGTVWLAEQTTPVRRQVALKVIKPGMDSKQVLARFEVERQALALMNHPNLANVLDGGATAEGRPFFVMELVRGAHITRYCDEHRLTVRQRLELFVGVCQAIQHAHQKGVIHRDIKPSNVLVAVCDGRPVPKVIDFGVAKAAGQPLTEKTLFTGLGGVVGTPEYMSPEQATLHNLDVDTRSDVYSLGVLLYELLAGSTPFSRKELEETGLLEMLRVIREQEPPRPSTKLRATQASEIIAAARQSDSNRLPKALRRELDWVVMKALEKDRNRRYESANSLAVDVQRYLADDRVQACPPSAAYRVRKFVRRNRGAVLAASLVMLALITGIVGTTFGMLRANRERDDKVEALRREERGGYFRLVGLAHRELEANVVGRADQLLDACPEHLRGWEWRYLKRLRFADAHHWQGHGSWVMDITAGGGAPIVAASDQDEKLTVWNVSTGRTVSVLDSAPKDIWSVVFSLDGQQVASANRVRFPMLVPLALSGELVGWSMCMDCLFEIRIADVRTGRLLLSFPDYLDDVVSMAFSPDNQWLATGTADGAVKIWDAHTGQEVRALSGHTKRINRLRFSPDRKWLASCSDDETVKIWDWEMGRETHTLLRHTDGAVDVAFSPDGLLLASVGLDSRACVWEVASGKSIRALVHPAPTHGVAFSPDGQRLAVGGWDYTVKIWDVASFEEILTLRGHTQVVRLLSFSRDGNQLVSGSINGSVRLWDGSPLDERPPGEFFAIPYKDCIFAVAYRNDGNCLAAASLDRTVTLWDPRKGRRIQTLLGHTGLVWAVTFSRDGRFLASASYDGTAKVWDANTGEVIHTLVHSNAVFSASYSPDGSRLATACSDGTVRIWDTRTGQVVLEQHGKHSLDSVAYSPDGRFVASGDMKGRIAVWDATTRRDSPLLLLDGHRDHVRGLAYSHDGRRIVSASYDGTVKVWDAATGEVLNAFQASKERVVSIAISPDNQRLITAATDAMVKVWSLENKAPEILTIKGHAGMVFGVAYNPDGKSIAAGSGLYARGELRIWDVAEVEMRVHQERPNTKQ